ncbi:MAG: hypothetical protein K5888_12670 [Lachnospiraceae bacterium]|nr:hypothetical protein [Lachnospiraceae bacterium]
MIMIDVLIPPLDESFDLEIDETITLKDFVNKLTDIVENVRNVRFRCKEFGLFSFTKGEFIKEGESFELQGIRNGERLVLV